MHSKDKISKASWNHFISAKDTLSKNIVVAVQNGELKIEQEVLPKLISIIDSSLSEGYHKGHIVFEREVANILKVNNVQTQQGSVTQTKKKLI